MPHYKSKRHWVVALRRAGITTTKCTEIAGVSLGFVHKWEKRYRDTGNVERKVGSGRPGTIPLVKRFIRKELRKTNSPGDTVRRLNSRHGIQIHRTTIWRIAKGMRMKPKPRKKQPLLSQRNRRDRLEFARKYVNKPNVFWRKWLFTDEKKYYRMSLKKTQWCLEHETPKPQLTTAVPPQTYVWAGISYRGRTPLHHIKAKLTAASYQQILKRVMLPAIPDCFPTQHQRRTWTFQQDSTGRGVHGALWLREWIMDNENIPNYCFPWPGNSPDLNPIENVWRLCNIAIQKRKPRTAQGYWRLLKQEWMKVPQQTIKKLIDSMPRRLQAVIDANGGNTKY